jgi:hypothetical protein
LGRSWLIHRAWFFCAIQMKREPAGRDLSAGGARHPRYPGIARAPRSAGSGNATRRVRPCPGDRRSACGRTAGRSAVSSGPAAPFAHLRRSVRTMRSATTKALWGSVVAGRTSRGSASPVPIRLEPAESRKCAFAVMRRDGRRTRSARIGSGWRFGARLRRRASFWPAVLPRLQSSPDPVGPGGIVALGFDTQPEERRFVCAFRHLSLRHVFAWAVPDIAPSPRAAKFNFGCRVRPPREKGWQPVQNE